MKIHLTNKPKDEAQKELIELNRMYEKYNSILDENKKINNDKNVILKKIDKYNKIIIILILTNFFIPILTYIYKPEIMDLFQKTTQWIGKIYENY